MTIYQLLTVRDAAKLGAHLAKLAAKGDERVVINFGVADHADMCVDEMAPADKAEVGCLDSLIFDEFKESDMEMVFDSMEVIVEFCDSLRVNRTFVFEGFSSVKPALYWGGVSNTTVVTLRWGS
jgi:hypothetical protein